MSSTGVLPRFTANSGYGSRTSPATLQSVKNPPSSSDSFEVADTTSLLSFLTRASLFSHRPESGNTGSAPRPQTPRPDLARSGGSDGPNGRRRPSTTQG